MATPHTRCSAFEGSRRIASGEFKDVAPEVKRSIARGQSAILVFDDSTGAVIDVSLREKVAEKPERRPGRPKLGVVAREVTLLPRHWEWLNLQPGGASVVLRRLVDEARRVTEASGAVRQSQEAAYRFLSAMAGNEPGFEEATRALFAGRKEDFEQLSEPWPVDVRDYGRRLATGAFAGKEST